MLAVARTPEQKALCSLTGLMGLRVSEALSVMLADFDHSAATLTVRGKGDKTRTVPVSPRAWENLVPRMVELMTLGEQRLVSLSDRGARIVITTLGQKAGLSRSISSHDMRATFATAAYDKSLDIRAVQELLGHGSSQTTEIYTGVRLDTMREAANL